MRTISLKNKLETYFNNSESKLLDGLSYSSDSVFLNSLGESKKVIITKDNLNAKKIYKELHFLSKEDSRNIILIPGTEEMPYDIVAVSYTHLTLPTKRIV